MDRKPGRRPAGTERLVAYVQPETAAWVNARSSNFTPVGKVIDAAIADAQSHRSRETKEIVGYPHVIVRVGDEGEWMIPPELDEETGCESPAVAYGWHGDDHPPCGGQWIAGLDDGRVGAIVVTEDPEPPSLPDGWESEEFSEDEGWWYADESGWKVFLIRQDSDGEAVFVSVGGV